MVERACESGMEEEMERECEKKGERMERVWIYSIEKKGERK